MQMKSRWLSTLMVLALAVAGLAANVAYSQGIPTGTLNGTVTDENGAPLPGVSVTTSSPALQGTRTTVTNVNGDYTFAFLPPGDYSVKMNLSGFQAVTKTAKVSSGQTIAVSAKLSLAGVATVVTVSAQSETVSQGAAATTTYSADTLDKLPVARTIQSSVSLTPGINTNGPNGAITVAGGMSYDSTFTVNGVNIQDNIRGTPTAVYIEDAIQETSTMTSGVSAEYGRFTGGVVNAVTKRGGNEFSGSFRMTENNDANKAQTPIKTTYLDKWIPTYEGTLGGPIWKDTIWFFGAVRYNDQKTSSSTAAVTPGGPTQSFPQRNLNDRYEGKLTISPVPNHTLTADYTWTTTHSDNYYFTTFPVLDTNVMYNRQTPSDLLTFQYNGVLTSDFFLEGSYSKKTFTFINSGGTDTSLIGGTAGLSQQNGYGQFFSPIFCGVCSPEKRDNQDISAKGTYFLSSEGIGTMNIAVGYQNFQSKRLSNNYQSGSSWLAYFTGVAQVGGNLYPVVDSSTYLLYAPIPTLSQGSNLETNSVFINDNWKLGTHLSFNLGVRWDKNHALDAAGHLVADDSQFSPRLAASYDPKGDGTFRVTGSYARYVGQIQEGIAGSGATSAGSPASYYYYWAGAPINATCGQPGGTCTPTAQVLAQMYGALGVTGVNQFPNVGADVINLPGVNQVIISPLKSPNANEYSIGIGGTLGANFSYRIDGIRREFADFYALNRNLSTGHVADALGNEYDLGLYVNTNVPTRNYTAMNMSLAYRAGALNVGANWTWSHTIGNFVGENSGSGPLTFQGLNYPEYVQSSWNTPKGDLSQDQRHRVNIYGSYDFRTGPVTLTPGLLQSINTGTPYGAVGSIRSYPYVPANLACTSSTQTNCYLNPPTTVSYYFTSRDAYRTNTINRTDISLNIAGKIGPVELFLMPQVFNLLNNQGVTLVNNTNAINTSVLVGTGTTPNSNGLVRFNPFTTAPIECPQTDTAAQCAALGANWKKGPSFGAPVSGSSSQPSFQIPRQWLLTFGARF
ncbi:MAG TPA: carboxypeptidase regulatory-like domain-containing protein [Thermoanaerobaculia bacterium]|nr:carboxypeptidase regulatory-like domain-containing protein [Thermoanaerobaculia bacterium]